MKRINTFAIMFLSVVSLMHPGLGQCADYPASVARLITNARKVTKTVSMNEFKSIYDKKDYGLLLDVRDPSEYAAGHIPGAVNVSRGTLEFKIWKLVGGPHKPNYGKKITLYCSVGGRSVLAAKTLSDLGFTHVTAVNMKLVDWLKAGYPFDVEE